MRFFRGVCGVMVLAGFLVSLPVSGLAEEPKGSECDAIENGDQRNLCLAQAVEKNKKFGYKNKDHSAYYCSLIRSRDLQNFCFAISRSNQKMCDLIVDKKTEKDCNSNF